MFVSDCFSCVCFWFPTPWYEKNFLLLLTLQYQEVENKHFSFQISRKVNLNKRTNYLVSVCCRLCLHLLLLSIVYWSIAWERRRSVFVWTEKSEAQLILLLSLSGHALSFSFCLSFDTVSSLVVLSIIYICIYAWGKSHSFVTWEKRKDMCAWEGICLLM